MEWVAVLLVTLFAVFGSVYCIASAVAAWKEARRQAPVTVASSTKRRHALRNLGAHAVEFVLALVFVGGAAFVAIDTARTQKAAWWNALESPPLVGQEWAPRHLDGPNGSHLVVHYAAKGEQGPVVFVDSTSQPIGDCELRELVARFPEARDVLLGRTQVTDAGLQELNGCRHLEALSLQNLPITEHGLESLTGHTTLTFLDLSGTNVSDEALKRLAGFPGLEELRLCDTSISDAGLAHLHGLPHLRVLALSETNVTDQGISRLRADRPELAIERKGKTLPRTGEICLVDRP